MASTEAKNILVWFQVSLHTTTKVIFIKFPVSKNPQGLLNNKLTKKKSCFTSFVLMLCQWASGFQFTHHENIHYHWQGSRCAPSFVNPDGIHKSNTEKILQPSWLNNSGHVCILLLLPKLSLQLQDPTNCPHKPYIHSTMSYNTIFGAWSYLDI